MAQDHVITRDERLALEERPILADLRGVGLNVCHVWDVRHESPQYRLAVPILLKHLQLPYSDETRYALALSLAHQSADSDEAWKTLIMQYRATPFGTGITAPGDVQEYRLNAKDGIANALAAIMTNARIPDVVSLITDRTHGESRLILLHRLRRFKNPLIQRIVDEVADDPDLHKEIASWPTRSKTG